MNRERKRKRDEQRRLQQLSKEKLPEVVVTPPKPGEARLRISIRFDEGHEPSFRSFEEMAQFLTGRFGGK